jgi:hypothetical protein
MRISDPRTSSSFLISMITFLISFDAGGQKHTETLEIKLPEKKISGCLYNSIKLIDERIDTMAYGIIQLGAFNKKAKVIMEVPLRQQLTAVVNAMTDNTAKNEELVLLLRQFSLAEITGAFNENGYCYMRAILFGSGNGVYHRLTSIDTVITISSMDVTRALLRRGSSVITDLIIDNIRKAPADAVNYTFNDLVYTDSLEKRDLFVYNTTEYKTGAYKTFASFVNQQPGKEDLLIEFWKNTDHVKSVQFKNQKGKFVEMELKPWYAFVFQNRLYINTDFGVYPLEKKGNDFYFTGKARSQAKAGDVAAATFFFGIIGGLMASSGGVGVFEMKIDHLTGGFIHLREVK